MRRGAMRRGAIVALALALACALRATPARARALDVDDARWRLGTARATTTSDCDACETFMRAVEAKIEQGQFQGEMAAAIAEACARATRGEASQMSVCVAAGEAGLRFATRYLENHPELGDRGVRGAGDVRWRRRRRRGRERGDGDER